MLGKSAVFDFAAIAAVTGREIVTPQPECVVVEAKSGSMADRLVALPKDAKVGTTFSLRMLSDYVADSESVPDPTNPKVQPFMIYSVMMDEMVPLTQERLDQLIAAECQYGQLICHIRDSHQLFMADRGYTAKSFAEVKAS
jgi:hypothetical protein